MINKKIVLVISVFIIAGFLIFSFANPKKIEEVVEDSNQTINKDDNSSSGQNNITNIGQITNLNNSQATVDGNLVNNYEDSELNNNTDSEFDSNNNSNYQADNSESNNPSGDNDNSNQTSNGTDDESANNNPNLQTDDDGNNSGNTEQTIENPNDVLSGPSSFLFDEPGIIMTQDGNTVTFSGTMSKKESDIGINSGKYLCLKIKAPYVYSDDVLSKMYLKLFYSGNIYDKSVLEYDTDGYPYIEYYQEFAETRKEFSLEIDWGTGNPIVYTLIFNITVI